MTKPALLAELRWESPEEYVDADDSAVVPGFRCHISSVARRRSSCLADCPAVMLTGRRDQFHAAMAGRPMLAR